MSDIRFEEMLINNLKEEINELKQQLAESEIRSKESEIFYKREINRRDTKLRNIKQSLKETIDHYEKYCAELNSQNVMLYASAFNLSQDKISFCIDKLNYLQDIIDNRVDEYLQSHDMDNYNCFVTHQGMYSCFEILVEEIDNQIKQLKEGK